MFTYFVVYSAIVNYLGHAYLSFGDPAVLAGNMIGDHVKGLKALDAYPEDIRQGILLHRSIDRFTDEHPVMLQAKRVFRPGYGLYAGAITDTLLDYFLANDSSLFATAGQLKQFSEEIYAKLETRKAYLPVSFLAYFRSMKEHDWLSNYRSYDGIRRSLYGLHRRAKQMPDPAAAFDLFRAEETLLRTYYESFIGDVISFVKIGPAGG